MDYKELIEQLNSASILHGTWLRERMLEAADAIETLLGERDAAIKSLHGVCGECKYHGSGFHRFPCDACSIRGTGLIDRWQWRGPQKESGGHGKT